MGLFCEKPRVCITYILLWSADFLCSTFFEFPFLKIFEKILKSKSHEDFLQKTPKFSGNRDMFDFINFRTRMEVVIFY